MEKNASFFDPEFWNDLDRLAKGVCFRDGAPMPRLTTASSARLPIDLYLWWFERIKFRTSKPSVGKFPPTFSFIAEGDVVGFRDWAEQQSQDKNSEAYIPVRIPEEYLEALSATGKPARYFTFDLKVPGKKQWLAAPGYTHGRQNNAEIDSVLLGKRLKRLITCGHITRLQLGFPLGSAQADETEPDARAVFADHRHAPSDGLEAVPAR